MAPLANENPSTYYTCAKCHTIETKNYFYFLQIDGSIYYWHEGKTAEWIWTFLPKFYLRRKGKFVGEKILQ